MQTILEDFDEMNPDETVFVSAPALEQIKDQTAVLFVQVDPDNTGDSRLKAQLAFMAKHCRACVLLLADTLARFNLAYVHADDPDFSLAKVHALALQKGEHWIKRCQPLLEQAFPAGNYTIVRWDAFVSDADFKFKRSLVTAQLQSDPDDEKAMREAVEDSRLSEERRLGKAGFPKDLQTVFKRLRRAALIETCAVFLFMAEKGEQRLLYPDFPPRLIIQIFQKLIQPAYALLLLPLFCQSFLGALTQHPDFLRKMIDGLPLLLSWKDRQGRYVWCNRAYLAFLGLKRLNDLLGKTDEDVMNGAAAKRLAEIDRHVLATGQRYQFEERLLLSHQPERIFLSRKSLIKDSQSRRIGVLCVSVDVTERRQSEKLLQCAQEKAETAVQAKKAFLENMRHDFRTPLAGMISLAETLKRRVKNAKTRRYADALAKSGHVLLAPINRILDYSRQQAHPPLANLRPFNLKETLQSVIDLNQPATYAKNLTLRLVCEESLPAQLVSDGQFIQRMLLELITNAIKFTSKGGH